MSDSDEFKSVGDYGPDEDWKSLEDIADTPPAVAPVSKTGEFDRINDILTKGLSYYVMAKPQSIKVNFFGMDDEHNAKMHSDESGKRELSALHDDFYKLRGSEPPYIQRKYIDAVSGGDPIMKFKYAGELFTKNVLGQVEKKSETMVRNIAGQLEEKLINFNKTFRVYAAGVFFALIFYIYRQTSHKQLSQKTLPRKRKRSHSRKMKQITNHNKNVPAWTKALKEHKETHTIEKQEHSHSPPRKRKTIKMSMRRL